MNPNLAVHLKPAAAALLREHFGWNDSKNTSLQASKPGFLMQRKHVKSA
jgi:hypothetical protein